MATASAPQADLRTTPQPKLATIQSPLNLWRLISLWHLTSLDAPTVAVTWTLAFAWATQIHLPIWLPVTLALSAWTFYIADRLMDANSAYKSMSSSPSSLVPGPSPLRPRHHFHWQHRRIFLPIAIASALVAVALVLHYMPLPARERNLVLAAATLIYFTTVHTPFKSSLKFLLKLPKELIVGILFTAACVLPVLTRIPTELRQSLTPALAVATLAYIALAWLNCHAIESWESLESRKGQGSVTRLATAHALISSSAAVATLHHPRVSLLLCAATVSAILLICLDRDRPNLNPTTLRAAADLALLAPLMLLTFR